ncbi:MAG TPA: LysE family translocator [Aliidongia sp.]|uniref:LysE family translocator n=1 Tax=Aliidongia sp. TaxID=1914230 RepID=UPI002DDD94B4|nr:LysE family translocator [Aliidongia sp.]HEV2675871.1 LysE family translocator [Aliidongia sp.]
MPTDFLWFLGAALVVALTPGPGIFYVAGRALAGGRSEGLASSFGTGLGGLVHVMAGAIGLSALVMASATAFTVLKLMGAVYLVYLGVQTWRSARVAESPATGSCGARRAFVQGIMVEATNPKTAAFFLAFVPQFVEPAQGSVAQQFMVLGLVSVALNTAVDVLVSFGAAAVRHRLARGGLVRRLRQGSGALMVALGLSLALSRQAGAR